MELSAGRKSPWFTLISSPTRFFATRKEQLGFAWVTVVTSIVSAVVTYIVTPYAEQSPANLAVLSKLSGAQLAAVTRIDQILPTASSAGILIGTWIQVLLGALLVWLFVKVFGYAMTYRNALGVVAHAAFILMLGNVVSAIVTTATGTYARSFLSLYAIAQPLGFAGNILAGISIFALWAVYIATTAVSTLTDAPKSRAIWIILVAWVISLPF